MGKECCIDCGNEAVGPDNAVICTCGQIVCDECAREVETGDGRVEWFCAACANKYYPQNKIELRGIVYTAVLDCGHVVGITEEQFKNASTIGCYKCYDAQKEKTEMPKLKYIVHLLVTTKHAVEVEVDADAEGPAKEDGYDPDTEAEEAAIRAYEKEHDKPFEVSVAYSTRL